jgi:hypothetical protein
MTVEIMGVDDTLGINVGSADHDLLAELLKSHITRNSVQICGEVQDELLTSLSRILGNGTDGEEHVLKMKRCLISIRMDHYPRFGHHESFSPSLPGRDEWSSLVTDIHKDVALIGVIRRLVPSWASSWVNQNHQYQ